MTLVDDAVEAWCVPCQGARAFTFEPFTFAEAGMASSLNQRALRAEPSWTCDTCGGIRFSMFDEETITVVDEAAVHEAVAADPGGGSRIATGKGW